VCVCLLVCIDKEAEQMRQDRSVTKQTGGTTKGTQLEEEDACHVSYETGGTTKGTQLEGQQDWRH